MVVTDISRTTVPLCNTPATIKWILFLKAIKRMEGRPIVEGLQGMMGYFYMCSEHHLVR